MTTATTITDSQIRTLRDEAAANGDEAQVNLCNAALGLAESWMVDEAREQCAKAIAIAEAADAADLIDYVSGEWIRRATSEECAASRGAARIDGGAGVITVDGRRCYVLD